VQPGGDEIDAQGYIREVAGEQQENVKRRVIRGPERGKMGRERKETSDS